MVEMAGHLHLIGGDTTNHSLDWDAWQALGYDVNSDTGTVALTNIWADSINAYKLFEGSAGIDEGTDLSAFLQLI